MIRRIAYISQIVAVYILIVISLAFSSLGLGGLVNAPESGGKYYEFGRLVLGNDGFCVIKWRLGPFQHDSIEIYPSSDRVYFSYSHHVPACETYWIKRGHPCGFESEWQCQQHDAYYHGPLHWPSDASLNDFETPVVTSVLSFPRWYTAMGLIFPIIHWACGPRRRRNLRRRHGLCIHCAYDLTGNVSGVCPECGTKARAMDKSEPEA